MRPPETRFRPVRIAPIDTTLRYGADGSTYMESPHRLGPYPTRITERLEYWAEHAPGRPFLAQRRVDGGWRSVSYLETLERVRGVAQALLDRHLSNDRPVVILSGNSIEHAVLGLAAMYSGVVYAPV